MLDPVSGIYKLLTKIIEMDLRIIVILGCIFILLFLLILTAKRWHVAMESPIASGVVPGAYTHNTSTNVMNSSIPIPSPTPML